MPEPEPDPTQRAFSSVSEAVKGEVRVALEGSLESLKTYHASDVERASAEVCTSTIERLQREARTSGFKFIVNCTIVPKVSGFGLHSSTANFWDAGTDGSCLVRWENDALLAVVHVYGLAI